jgi:hypothetical protein
MNSVLIVPLDPAYKAGLAGHLPAKIMIYSRNEQNPVKLKKETFLKVNDYP